MNYKIVRIAKYVKKGKESVVSIPYSEFKDLIEMDINFDWYEDVSERFRLRQLERDKPALKKCFVYKFQPLLKIPYFRATYISGTDDIIAGIYSNYQESILLLKKLADNLDSNLYE